MQPAAEQFVQQLTGSQNRLFGYVYSLLGDRSRAADVLQETNLVLWRKIDEYDAQKPFLPWAFAIARFQVLAHLRDQRRDRMLLDAELAETLSSEVQQQVEQVDAVRQALQPCMQSLSEDQRKMIQQRYFQSMSMAEISAAAGKPASAIKMAIMRIRKRLAGCIESRLATEG